MRVKPYTTLSIWADPQSNREICRERQQSRAAREQRRIARHLEAEFQKRLQFEFDSMIAREEVLPSEEARVM